MAEGGSPMHVASVAADGEHRFSKPLRDELLLVAGHGVAGDAHCGETVQHLSRVRVDPTQPNLRQVHLIHAELLEELAKAGFEVPAGALGENILTKGVDLLALPRGTRLGIGPSVWLELTGLRNPCRQIDNYRSGLLKAVLDKAEDGQLIRKCGVMSVVLIGGTVRPGDAITVELPAQPHQPLEVV